MDLRVLDSTIRNIVNNVGKLMSLEDISEPTISNEKLILGEIVKAEDYSRECFKYRLNEFEISLNSAMLHVYYHNIHLHTFCGGGVNNLFKELAPKVYKEREAFAEWMVDSMAPDPLDDDF